MRSALGDYVNLEGNEEAALGRLALLAARGSERGMSGLTWFRPGKPGLGITGYAGLFLGVKRGPAATAPGAPCGRRGPTGLDAADTRGKGLGPLSRDFDRENGGPSRTRPPLDRAAELSRYLLNLRLGSVGIDRLPAESVGVRVPVGLLGLRLASEAGPRSGRTAAAGHDLSLLLGRPAARHGTIEPRVVLSRDVQRPIGVRLLARSATPLGRFGGRASLCRCDRPGLGRGASDQGA